MNNNPMESFNGNTVCLREETARGLKKKDSPILSGLRVYHNFVRPHLALDGRTPAEAAGILVEGENRTRAIIRPRPSPRPDPLFYPRCRSFDSSPPTHAFYTGY